MMISVFLFAVPSFANCFDFKTKILKPLKEPELEARELGTTDEKVTWGKIRGAIQKPLGKVLDLLLDHNNTKSTRVKELEVTTVQDPNYLTRQRVKFIIKPFLFITIDWTEEWAFALASGTKEKPTKVVISYEKVEGTGHIEHLCGSIVLRKVTDSSTDFYYYEEAKATQRSAKDTINGLEGTLNTLRKL